MDDLIQISKINDFIFCPYSLFVHSIYEEFLQNVYHDLPQMRGKIAHENIEKGKYSDLKRYIQNLSVYSEKYGLVGKIDIYDKQEKALIERKYRIKQIYDGHIYQLWGEYFAMREVGYEVEKLFVHSLSDNKRYVVDLPNEEGEKKFVDLLDQMKSFDVSKQKITVNQKKCDNCIYRELCGEYIC
jgi:CRISPR-associated protein Cas4